MFRTIVPGTVTTAEMHQFLLAAVAPRPIAFVSTVDENGVPNLAPYSFFNAFSSNPPIIIFSSNRRVRDNTTKDTLHNVTTTREAVINMVSHSIVHQAAVASCEYPNEVSEFVKAGLTPIPSEIVKPFRVAESPVQMECVVKDIISLGEHGGAGNLIMCEVVRFHVNENVLDERGKIDQNKIDLMGRMGRIAYVRASGDAIINIAQPVEPLGMGFDGLPAALRNSKTLTGNDLGMLAGKPDLPTAEAIEAARNLPEIATFLTIHAPHSEAHHLLVQSFLKKSEVDMAWAVAMV
jgi:flavin reductase (DIM6/NTAB) family NADH-FMN oxidoreductase RutF